MPNAEKPARKKTGRPPKSPDGQPRITHSMRLRGQIREQLIEAAKKAERSISEEIEHRVEQSFVRDGYVAEAKAARDAARIQAIRDAALQIVHEAGGGVTVNVSLEMLHAKADGIVRSGFVDPADPRNARWQKPGEIPAAPVFEDMKRAVVEALEEAGIARPKTKAA